jgi:hypothetical protein
MPNRTIKFLGQGYGATPAEVTITANGNTVFSGTVDTVDELRPVLPNPNLNLNGNMGTFEIDQAFRGQIPMTCTVNSGTVIFAQIVIDNVYMSNPSYTAEQMAALSNPATTPAEKVAIYTTGADPSLSQQDIDTLLDPATTPAQAYEILVAHNCQPWVYSGDDYWFPLNLTNADPRTSVSIDGVLQTPDRDLDLDGTWWWTVFEGSTMSYQLTVDRPVSPIQP